MQVNRRAVVIVVAVLAMIGVVAPAHAGSDYSDAAYLQHDLDNVGRSTVSGRQLASLTNPAYGIALTPATIESYLTNLGRQAADVSRGRVYATLGQLLPGGAVGDPLAYRELKPTTVAFESRTGAKLVGRLWSDGLSGPHPGVVITPGSIQGTQHMYWWAARTLAESGFLVLTFDVQGQGESETFGHSTTDHIPTGDGVPFQQEANFVDGTVDALRYLFSTSAHGYVPGTWSDAKAAAARGQGDRSLSWVNPLAGSLDTARVALAGHSLGARAISVVQQCSDAAELWRTLPVCTGRSFPIKAVVAWDGLSSTGVVPVVPAMNQQADGYFLNPEPTYTAPDPRAHLSGFDAWRAAGLDTYALTVRGGTHLEWVDVPYILPSTTYGVRLADYYTLAWLDRYLSPRQPTRALGAAALASGPRSDHVTSGADELPWRADFMSARYLGAFSFHDDGGSLHEATDLRAYSGLSPVGDWSGANTDQPAVRAH